MISTSRHCFDCELSLFFSPHSSYADPLIKLCSEFVVVVGLFFSVCVCVLLGLEFALLGCEAAVSPGCV